MADEAKSFLFSSNLSSKRAGGLFFLFYFSFYFISFHFLIVEREEAGEKHQSVAPLTLHSLIDSCMCPDRGGGC